MNTAETVWYAVHTRPRAERTALQNLLRQGYSAYLPCYRTAVSHARRRQSVLRPLFPRYLFAGLDRAKMRWRPILSTFGVSGVVRAGDEPVPVADAIMASLREREAAGVFDCIATRHALRVGELVRITAGAFEDLVGRLLELDDQDRVVVLLEVLGREVRTRLGATAIEAA
jgi:transcriptional antiterminator RfaH